MTTRYIRFIVVVVSIVVIVVLVVRATGLAILMLHNTTMAFNRRGTTPSAFAHAVHADAPSAVTVSAPPASRRVREPGVHTTDAHPSVWKSRGTTRPNEVESRQNTGATAAMTATRAEAARRRRL